MSKIDASELVKSLERSLKQTEDCLVVHEERVKRYKEDIENYKYLLSLVKYEEDETEEPSTVFDYIYNGDYVDWSKVPVDTLVEVRDYEKTEWKLRSFHSYIPHVKYSYKTFHYGNNGANSDGKSYMGWMQCRLYEGEK